jgi:hypothetical protein
MTGVESPRRGPSRAPILLVVVLAIAGGIAAGRATTSSEPPAPTAVYATQIPKPGAISTAWYCPGLPSAFPNRDQTITLSNLSSSAVDAAVTVQPDDQNAAPVTRTVSVPRESVRTFDRASFSVAAGPVVVEPFSSDVMVSAGLETQDALATVPCANTASADWYFAAGTTVRGVSQWLVLDDPFSTEARVDVSLRTDEGLELLPGLQGIDVAGRSRVVVRIDQEAVRQARIAIQVHAELGQVVAAQTLQFGAASGPTGVATSLGALAPASQWWFTDSRMPPGASQYVALTSLGPLDAQVAVQALIGSAGLVQPVVLKVAADSVSWVQIGGCGRGTPTCLGVPANTGFELVVQSDAHVPIVAQTLGRFGNVASARGAVTSMGSTDPARRWVIARTRALRERSTSISLMNAGVRAATVNVQLVHGGVTDAPDGLQHLSIAGGSRLVVPAGDLGSNATDDAAVVVTSDVPIFAESTIYTRNDATRAPGIPAR